MVDNNQHVKCCDKDIEAKLERLRSLRLDVVKYRDSGVLLRHYSEVIRPKVDDFIHLCQTTDNEVRLLDLVPLGYRITLDDQGKLDKLTLRNWGVEPGEWGP